MENDAFNTADISPQLQAELAREAQDNSWVYQALLERERAVQDIIEAGATRKESPELWHRYQDMITKAEFRKLLVGIEEPFGPPN